MGRRANQFLLLLWKNYTLQKRRVISTIFEIGVPVLISLILIAIRTKVDYIVYSEPTLYNSYPIERLPGNLTRSALQSTWQMAYSPNVPLVDRIMTEVVKNLGSAPLFNARLVPGGKEFLKFTHCIIAKFMCHITKNTCNNGFN